jgi:MFS family permease
LNSAANAEIVDNQKLRALALCVGQNAQPDGSNLSSRHGRRLGRYVVAAGAVRTRGSPKLARTDGSKKPAISLTESPVRVSTISPIVRQLSATSSFEYWHWIFWINVPIGVLACLLAPRLMHERHGPQARLGIPGVALISAGAITLVWGLVRAGDTGWGSAEVLTTIIAGLALLAAFVAWEHRARVQMVPLGLFRAPASSAGNATGFLMTAATFAAAFLVTQYFQFALQFSSLGAGVRLLPFFMTPMLISPAASAISDRIGRRPVIATGMLLLAVGLCWVALEVSTTWLRHSSRLDRGHRRRLSASGRLLYHRLYSAPGA